MKKKSLMKNCHICGKEFCTDKNNTKKELKKKAKSQSS